ncbi:MAG TPA: hypothetical protein VHU42_04340 [Rhodopila sp.]|nr:hypothetical protein [Rhodopila sp.]
MSDSITPAENGTTTADADVGFSRRRPGRIENVHPALIPLLRGKAGIHFADESPFIADAPVEHASMEQQKDALAPARGILFGIALSIPIWAVLIFCVFHLLGGVVLTIALSIPVWIALSLAACYLL